MDTTALKTQDKTLATIVHLAGLMTSWFGPLVIYLIKKDNDAFTAAHAREALNFQITLMLAFIVCAILTVVLIGLFMMWVVVMADLIFSIVAAVKASNGKDYRYPLTIRLIK